ncbi:MAG: ABC transporter ATP-binding protein [Pseudomonadota bacterium]
MMNTEPVICFDKVAKTYRADLFGKKTPALSDLSLTVSQGEVFGIIGPNGAGKSTALKILMGFVKYDGGFVSLTGHPPSTPACHEKLGYLPENPCLYENLTVTEQLTFAARISRILRGDRTDRIRKILDRVDLNHAANMPIRRFSKGMTQRAALAYALIHEPDILVLDEPMSGLDPLGRRLVVDIIKEYNEAGHTILFCSHVLTDVERICDRIGIMDKGRLAAVITPDELDRKPVSNERGAASPLEAFFMETVKKG